MDDPTPVTDLVPSAAPLEEQEVSSGVREKLRRATDRAGIDRQSLMAQIGHGVPMSHQQRQKLLRQATDDIVSILPTGEIYVEGKHWRDVLNDTFGPMQWGIVSPTDPLYEPAPPPLPNSRSKPKSMLYLEVFLIVKGRCVAYSLGAQEYFPESVRMTKDDAVEGCRTNGIMRCLKQFGIFGNLWDSKWADPARARVGVKVRTDDRYRSVQWRRLDDEPLMGEQGVMPDSPNFDAYIAKYGHNGPFRRQQQASRGDARPAPPEDRPQDRPTPPDVIETSAKNDQPEKVLVIRPVKYTNTNVDPPQPATMWVVNTDVTGEYVTNDEHMVKALERIKAEKKRIIVSYEPVQGRNGTRRRILEYRVVD